MSQDDSKGRIKFAQYLLNGLIIYYWASLYFVEEGQRIERFSALYAALVLPVIAFSVLLGNSICRDKYKKGCLFLALFTILVSVVSVARSDVSCIFSVLLFTLPLIIIWNSNLSIDLRLINSLFIVSVVLAVITFHLGMKNYGYIPGQSITGDQSEVWWRISLFPFVPESAYFSFTVLLGNAVVNKNKSKWIFISLSGYFLVFSGIRSLAICMVLIAVLHFFYYIFPFQKSSLFYRFIAIPLLLVCGIGFLAGSGSILLFSGFENEFLANLIFRRNEWPTSSADIETSILRTFIWSEHLRVFMESPVIGIGDIGIAKMLEMGSLGGYGSGSESILTLYLVRVGLMIIPFLVFFYWSWVLAINRGRKLEYAFVMLALMGMLTYGSCVVPYNCVYYLMFCGGNGFKV